jgi:hypothetical protein
MSGCKCNIIIIIVLFSLFSFQAFSQQINIGNSLIEDNSAKVIFRPRLNYIAGSSFIFVPHLGSVTVFTLSPSLSIPLSPKLSVDGGIFAGYSYSAPWHSSHEGAMYGSYNELSVYGSATYHLNPQLTLYGSAIKQLATTSPYFVLPKSSYTIGSAYDFGNFSIGVTLHMSKWDNIYNPYQIKGSQGFYSPFNQGWGSH